MSTLYVIGNGFDLWHDLPTSYRHFYEFAEGCLDELENYYSFDLHEYEPWHDFENALGDFCWENFFDYYNEIDVGAEDFRPSFVYGLEDEITEQTDIHVTTIKEAFLEWIAQIDIREANRKMLFPDDAQFINFNYTSTLQFTYGIDDSKVMHIHGRAEKNDDLIFGHGADIIEESEIDEDGESNRTMFSDAEGAAKYPLYALKKPVDEVLDKNGSYFNRLTGITEVIVIGHSLNNIDMPYFKKIVECAPGAQWKVCCYINEERTEHIQKLICCGIKLEHITVCAYDDL